MKRGTYDEIELDSLDAETRKAVQQLVSDCGNAAKVDEHGSWEFGAQFNSRGRGEALNWDLYAIGQDVHSGKMLAIVQIRKARITKYGTSVRKNYFLCGYNEDGSAFAHPASANVIRTAIRLERDPILAVQDWMFAGDYADMVRQGDVALVPVKRAQGQHVALDEMIVEGSHGSHKLEARVIRKNGYIYALDPILTHTLNQHPTVSATGWYRVIVAERGHFWKFAAPTKD